MRVLITGAAGTIGRDLRAGLRGRHELLRLLDVAEQEPARAGEEVVTGSVADAEAMRDAAAGVDAVEPEPPGLARELDGGPYVARLHDPKYD
jgi:uronate dehydrogenase